VTQFRETPPTAHSETEFLDKLLVTKWTARGLTQAVLQAIRTDVFNVSAPIAP